MTTAVIKSIYLTAGSRLTAGAKLIDLSVDLSRSITHDCPPISYFRIALREPVWLRRMMVGRGEEIAIGDALALCSSDPDEPLDGAPARALRVTIAGIVYQAAWWDQS
jgi:hypothetical protein